MAAEDELAWSQRQVEQLTADLEAAQVGWRQQYWPDVPLLAQRSSRPERPAYRSRQLRT